MKIEWVLEEDEPFTAIRIAEAIAAELYSDKLKEVMDFLQVIVLHYEKQHLH